MRNREQGIDNGVRKQGTSNLAFLSLYLIFLNSDCAGELGKLPKI